MEPGDVLGGRYQLVSLLGSGGFGTVWRAHDTHTVGDVAVKVSHPTGEEKAVQRFLAEAVTAGSLNNKHIVAVYGQDRAVHRGAVHHYLIMELLDGRPLDAVLAHDSPSLRQCLTWALQICDALVAAHAGGVIHRDIKPANVVIQTSGEAKVIDFGIAKNSALQVRLTATGTVLGSLPYMAPECFRGEEADARSDLYALGCLIAELCTGRRPFGGPAPENFVYQHTQLAPPAPSSLNPEVSAELDDLVLRLLAKKPRERPASAADVQRRILTVLRTLGGSAAGSEAATTLSARTPTIEDPASSAPTAPGPPLARMSRALRWGTGRKRPRPGRPAPTEPVPPGRPAQPAGYGPLYVVGDTDGHLDELRDALAAQGVTDADGRWAAGTGRLCFLGNFSGRGPDSIGVIELVMRLSDGAAEAGGYCKALMGDNEMRLAGERRFDLNTTVDGRQIIDSTRLTEAHRTFLSRLDIIAEEDGNLLIPTDTTALRSYGDSIEAVNRTVHRILSHGSADEARRLFEMLGKSYAFRDPLTGPREARSMLSRYGGRRVVHGRSLLPDFDTVHNWNGYLHALAAAREPHVYADGLAVAMGGGPLRGAQLLVSRLSSE